MRRLLLLLLLLFLPVPLLAQVSVSIRPPEELDAQNRGIWQVTVSSLTAYDAVPLTFSSASDPIIATSEGCTVTSTSNATCVADLQPAISRVFAFTVEYPKPFGHFQANASAHGASAYAQAVFAHEFPVTNANDSGEGSLRQAMLDINRDCNALEPCAPAFRIDGPVPADGYFTVHLLSPLPLISRQDFVLDGRTQSRHTLDTNPSGGPEIFLDGSAAGFAHGLDAERSTLTISNVVIGNFARNGIELRDGVMTLRGVWLGVDPSGVRAAPNGLRGVQSDHATVTIDECVLSGNRRAGGFFDLGSIDLFTVSNNRIGVGADGVTPVGNGASGIFVDKHGENYAFVVASGNTIGYNAHAGIALSIRVGGSFGSNSFLGNAGLPIDVLIDGPTPDMLPGVPGQGGIIGVPAIDSARYEDGETIVTGRLAAWPHSGVLNPLINLYANGEFLGSTPVQTNTFTIRVERDLRGKSVSASTFAGFVYTFEDVAYGTSEVSAAVAVE